MRSRMAQSEDLSSSLATLSRQMLSILVSLAIVFAAVPAKAQQLAVVGTSDHEVDPDLANTEVARQDETAESLQETLHLLQTPGFHQELSDLLIPELSLDRAASGDLATSPTESVLQEPEEDKGMSTGAKVAIIAAVAVGVIALVMVAIVNSNETGSPF